jgi:N-acetylglucosaminyl-diphospho-decaprenol L-rhamnosyltransferase
MAPLVLAEQVRGNSAAAFDVAVVVVSYARPEDVAACVGALRRLRPAPTFEVFVAENGGAGAFDRLTDALSRDAGCSAVSAGGSLPSPPQALRVASFAALRDDGSPGLRIHLAEMAENLGYAGGINAWLRPLLAVPCWRGAWILNPDTEPEPDALTELAAYAARENKGLVGSRLVQKTDRTVVQTRGLAWSRLRGTVSAIGRATAGVEPSASSIEALLDAPSGASMYATRALIDSIGLMSDHYFLYGEDLEWGVRAKRHGHSVGYADASVVPHEGGSTIGSARRRRDRSRLSVYLDLRNRLILAREQHWPWLPWTLVMALAEIGVIACAGPWTNAAAALHGFFAGLVGETGRPSNFSSLVRH